MSNAGRCYVRIGLIAVGAFLAGDRAGRALDVQNASGGTIYVIEGYLLPKGSESSPFPESSVWVTEFHEIHDGGYEHFYSGPRNVFIRIYCVKQEGFASFDKALESGGFVVKKHKWYAREQDPEYRTDLKFYARSVDDGWQYLRYCNDHEKYESSSKYQDFGYIWADNFYEFKPNTKITMTQDGWKLSAIR